MPSQDSEQQSRPETTVDAGAFLAQTRSTDAMTELLDDGSTPDVEVVVRASETCRNCSKSLRPNDRLCGYCHHDGGPPNVRLANDNVELSSLREFHEDARRSVRTNGTSSQCDTLEKLLSNSSMVINRNLTSLRAWVLSDDGLYLNFYKLKERGIPLVNDHHNRHRTSYENTVSPGFADDISVGALTIDDQGMGYYGPYAVVIRDDAIRDRATVFWENPFKFCRRLTVVSGAEAPAGHRATWQNRSLLGVAKLGGKLNVGDEAKAISQLLIGPDRTSEECDFIEVHVHKEIHACAIARVNPPDPPIPEDAYEWTFLRGKLLGLGAIC